MIGLDTNVVVRYLAQDDAGQAALANALLEHDLSPDNPGFISCVVLAEIVWVLEDGYGSARDDVAAILDRILRTRSLIVERAESAQKALRAFASGKADFADCLIASIGGSAGCEFTFTFDRLAARDAGMRLLGKG